MPNLIKNVNECLNFDFLSAFMENSNYQIPFVDFHSHFLDMKVEGLFQASDFVVENHLFSAGIHPWKADKTGFKYDLIAHQNCRAIGEVGLDAICSVDRARQVRVFIEMIQLSEQYEKPLILHCVRTWNQIRDLKREFRPKQTWIFHGFRKVNLLDEVLKEGVVPSFGAAILKDEKLLGGVKELQNDQFFLETDDAPMHISAIYRSVAKVKNIPLCELKSQQFSFFKTLFYE
jgi:TatD DNase family protein